jgi:hypothetical protein
MQRAATTQHNRELTHAREWWGSILQAMEADGREYTQTVIEGMLVRFFNYDRNGAGGINAGKQVRTFVCIPLNVMRQ